MKKPCEVRLVGDYDGDLHLQCRPCRLDVIVRYLASPSQIVRVERFHLKNPKIKGWELRKRFNLILE